PRTREEFQRAQTRLDRLEDALNQPIPSRPTRTHDPATPVVRATPQDEAFREMVSEAKAHIEAGEIEQLVLSRTFSSEFNGDPLDLYRALRMVNPSPFMFF